MRLAAFAKRSRLDFKSSIDFLIGVFLQLAIDEILRTIILRAIDIGAASFANGVNDHRAIFIDNGRKEFGNRSPFVRANDFHFPFFQSEQREVAVFVFDNPSEIIIRRMNLFGLPNKVIAIG